MALKFPRVIQPLSKDGVSHNVGGLSQKFTCDRKVFAQSNLTSWHRCEGPGLYVVGSLLGLLYSFCLREGPVKPEGCRWGGP